MGLGGMGREKKKLTVGGNGRKKKKKTQLQPQGLGFIRSKKLLNWIFWMVHGWMLWSLKPFIIFYNRNQVGNCDMDQLENCLGFRV
jgi:hypothetical protein